MFSICAKLSESMSQIDYFQLLSISPLARAAPAVLDRLPGNGMQTGCGCCYSTTLPPQPVRAAWWQSTLLIHVARVRIVRNVKQGAHPDLLHPPCGVGAGRRFSILSAVFWCEVGMDALVGDCKWANSNEIFLQFTKLYISLALLKKYG